MKPQLVIGISLSCLLVTGCGPSFESNPVIRSLPIESNNQIKSAFQHTSFDVYLPTRLPFRATQGSASATTPTVTGRSISQMVKLSLNDETELLQIQEPGSIDQTGKLIYLQDGARAYYETNQRFAILSWFDNRGSFTVKSSRIQSGNVHDPLGPELGEQQLVSIANSFQ